MKREFSKEIQGTYHQSKPHLVFSFLSSLILFTYIVFHLDLTLKILFLSLGLFVSLKIFIGSYRIKVQVTSDCITFTDGVHLHSIHLNDNIEQIVNDDNNLIFTIDGKQITLPPFGLFNEQQVFEELQAMGFRSWYTGSTD